MTGCIQPHLANVVLQAPTVHLPLGLEHHLTSPPQSSLLISSRLGAPNAPSSSPRSGPGSSPTISRNVPWPAGVQDDYREPCLAGGH